MAIEIAKELFEIVDKLERMKLYRFADQLRGPGLSMLNNISEGSGSGYKKTFFRYLDIARSSTFENANITIVLQRRGIIKKEKEE
ncbi:MAG: four helix bundle protein [Gracilimonas sp.]|uniref:four helix bundle protein n=1 Tax=Gracilimonas sp. TaxID=1974203 RepID=UPI0019BE7BE3|nr:four helix bundle protein [Gracilimonas sp.]MBD3616738.1 four helix bundle protein [Gracilimonas sp.]